MIIPSLLLAAVATGGLVNILIWLLVFVIVVAIAFWIVSVIPLPQPWGNIVLAILALIFLVILLNQFGIF